eukprot:977211-Prorocentrum_minimum.AAC.2
MEGEFSRNLDGQSDVPMERGDDYIEVGSEEEDPLFILHKERPPPHAHASQRSPLLPDYTAAKLDTMIQRWSHNRLALLAEARQMARLFQPCQHVNVPGSPKKAKSPSKAGRGGNGSPPRDSAKATPLRELASPKRRPRNKIPINYHSTTVKLNAEGEEERSELERRAGRVHPFPCGVNGVQPPSFRSMDAVLDKNFLLPKRTAHQKYAPL